MSKPLLNLGLNVLMLLVKLTLTTRSRRSRRGDSNYGYLIFGPDAQNVTNVNTLLRRDSRPTVTGRSFAFGGGGGKVRGKLRLGGEGEGGGETVIRGEQRSAYGHGSGGPTFAYELVRLGGLRVYPIVGFGGAGGGVMSSDVATPKTGTALGGGGPLFYGGLQVELTLGKFGESGRYVAGVRFGYRVKLWSALQRTTLRDGQAVESEAVDITEVQNGGPFFRFIVGYRG